MWQLGGKNLALGTGHLAESQVLMRSSWSLSGNLQLIEHNFIDIAPTPFFTGLERLNDRMICRAKMFGRVFVL